MSGYISDSGAMSHMTRNEDLVHDTWLPPPHRSRIILGDGSIKKVQFIENLYQVFYSRTDYPVTLYDVSFVPDLGFNPFSFNPFSFDVVQEKHYLDFNKTGAHLRGGRLVFPRRCNGLLLHATRVLTGGNANASTTLTTFAKSPSHRLDRPLSLLPEL